MFDTNDKKQQILAATKKKKTALVLKNATYLNVFTNEWLKGDIAIERGNIVGIGEYEGEQEVDLTNKYLVPSFVDSHMHFESAMVSPREFTKIALTHGTGAIICDPHEIANVLGEAGIDYILDTTDGLPVDCFVMASSCVPATKFDEAGATINSEIIEEYLKNPRVLGLAEMMNYPGVLFLDDEVLNKIVVTNNANKLIDGHAPGLTSYDLMGYISANVTTDHECTNYKEALEKLTLGQYIQVREGTASKNLEALVDLIKYPYSDRLLFATDDLHPSDMVSKGHIDYIIKKAISLGADPILCYKIASINAYTHYNMKYKGAIAPGYVADLVVLDDYINVTIDSVYKNGLKVTDHDNILNYELIYRKKEFKQKSKSAQAYVDRITDTFKLPDVTIDKLAITKPTKIIGIIPKTLLTEDLGEASEIDINNDILKLVVAERHKNTGHVGVCFVKGYKLKEGAIATSIAHDSHNIICIGTNDKDIAFAINHIKKMNGGMCVVKNEQVAADLELPIGGLMVNKDAKTVAAQMDKLNEECFKQGVSGEIDPFMNMSFTSLTVIPSIRLTTIGVVDVNKFELIK